MSHYVTQFWADQLEEFNGQDNWHGPPATYQTCIVYSDASDTGYGGYMIKHCCPIAQGQWLAQEAKQRSTGRELRAVHKVLESLITKLQDCRMHWFTGDQSVVRILTTGSRKPALQLEALAIFQISVLSRI